MSNRDHRRSIRALTLGWAVLLALLCPVIGVAGPPPASLLDPLASLRTEPGVYNCDLRIADLEPPGGEEFLARCIEDIQKRLDDELEFCQWADLLSKNVQRTEADGRSAFAPEDRATLIEEAEDKGCKSRKKSRDKPVKVNTAAKRWRKATGKLPGSAGTAPTPDQLRQYVDPSYDAGKFGEVDATGLYRLRQLVQLRQALLEQATKDFLVPVRGTAKNIDEVEDWKLYAKEGKPFGREVGGRRIENIVKELILVGTDETFTDLPDDARDHDFEGYFLYSRQILTGDDLTTTAVLVKRPEIESLAETARGLLEDFGRIHRFRAKQLEERPLEYAEAEILAAELFTTAAGIFTSQQDPTERLTELQKHFGAPVGRRTRTKHSKAIEWTGPLVAVSNTLDVEMGIDPGVEGQPIHTLAFNAEGTPLGEEACQGDVKLGQTVTVVGKVRKLEFDGSADTGAMRFTLTPLVELERGQSLADTDKKSKKGKSEKRKERPRRPSKRVRGGGGDVG